MSDEGRHLDSFAREASSPNRDFTISPTGYWQGPHVHAYHTTDRGLGEWMASFLNPSRHVTDLGCGTGGYLSILSRAGFMHLLGIEGEVPATRHFGNIQQGDLTKPLGLKPHGAVICLEVAEHIPPEHEKAFLDNVCGRVEPTNVLVMSWAVRGQWGDGHVNCRDNWEAVQLIEDYGFTHDPLESNNGRNAVSDLPWFRNTFMVFRRTA